METKVAGGDGQRYGRRADITQHGSDLRNARRRACRQTVRAGRIADRRYRGIGRVPGDHAGQIMLTVVRVHAHGGKRLPSCRWQ